MKVLNQDNVAIEVAGAQVTIPAATIAELWIEKLRGKPAELAFASATLSTPPRIGDQMDGGVYMGVVRGQGGAPDYQLIDLGEAPSGLNWSAALAWAKEKGGDLPSRRDQAVLFGNRGEGQFKNEWYWSNEQYAGYSGCAWIQGFGGGNQCYGPKDLEYRARAVRRSPIQ